MKNFNKIIWYMLYIAASTLLVYFLLSSGLSLLTIDSNINEAFITHNVILHFLFSFLLLPLIVIIQIKVLKQDDKKEELIYGCFNLIISLLENTLSIVLIVLAANNNNLSLLLIALIILLLGISETVYSIYLLVDQSKRIEVKEATSDEKDDTK